MEEQINPIEPNIYHKFDDRDMYSHLSKAERNAKIVDVRRGPKIGRNDPCTCGSGLKFKKCCQLKK